MKQHPFRRAVQAARDMVGTAGAVYLGVVGVLAIAAAAIQSPVMQFGVATVAVTVALVGVLSMAPHQQGSSSDGQTHTAHPRTRSRLLIHFTTFGSFVHVVRGALSWTSIQRKVETTRHRIVAYERKMAARITASPTWQRCQQLISPAPMAA